MVLSVVKRLLGRRDDYDDGSPLDGPLPTASFPRPRVLSAPAAYHYDASDSRRAALRKAFTPTRPLRSVRRLVGRARQLARVLNAVLDQAAHVVIYAERGRGKTSLTNFISEALRSLDFMVGSYTCAAEDDFDAILRGLLRSLPRSLLVVPAQIVEDRMAGCESAVPAGRLQPYDALGLVGRLSGGRLVLVVDEFDRVSDVATRTRLADTIKLLSDRAAPILFIIVGVSENLEELLGRHPSIQRNIIGVPLPLLKDTEIRTLLERGSQDAGVAFPIAAQDAIAAFARGVPHTAQLLALHAGYAVLEREGREVTRADLEVALEMAVAEADPRMTRLYEVLTEGGRDTAMAAFLRGLAGGVQDDFGRFIVEPAGAETMTVAGRVAPKELWRRLVEAGAVRGCGDGAPRHFIMAEATFGNYVLMRAACNGPGLPAVEPETAQAVAYAR
jgi:AAA ATPase domain